jgi:hypothetical protein
MPRFISLILLSAFSLLFSLGIQNHSFAQGWYNSGWSYRKAITVNSGQVPSAQSNFPVLISLTSDAGLSAHALANGNDILFTTSDGVTKIPYQRENYGGGTLVAWVNCPSVTNGTVLYMYYGNPGAADQQQATSAWDINYVGVYHVDEATTGIGDYKDATTTANNGMVQDAGTAAFLKTVFTVASADPSAAYVYEELTNPPNYTIASGDYLVYDVYWTSATTFIAVDLITTTAGALRDYGVVDQNGYGQHPAADLSPVALNKWYHRVIPLNVIATKIVDFYDIACTFKGTNKTGYVDNIFIMNGSTLKLAIRSPGGSTAHITNFQNPASGNTVTFSNVADPGSWSVTGKMVNCLAADGYRYINMGTRATTAVDNWTLEAWVNLDALSQHGYFVYNGNDGGGYGIGIGDGAGGAGTKLIGLAGSVAYIPSAYSFSTTGTWTHVVMKRTSGTATFLANGTSYAATAAGTSTPGAVAAKLTIGNELNASNSPTRYFSGLIDEVHISNVARTDNI